jgi:hypothetical protein
MWNLRWVERNGHLDVAVDGLIVALRRPVTGDGQGIPTGIIKAGLLKLWGNLEGIGSKVKTPVSIQRAYPRAIERLAGQRSGFICERKTAGVHWQAVNRL